MFVFLAKHGFGTFCSTETTLEAFVEEQANKNTLSKTKRDVSLLKRIYENERKRRRIRKY